jgi:Na+-driven multidrug efflux pump
MSDLFSQTIIVCGLVGTGLTLIYVVFTPQLVGLVAGNPAVYDNALAYFTAMRFYPLVDVFDTFLFAYVLYLGGYVHFYMAILSRICINAGLSWVLASRMGVMGIGLASFLFNAVALLVLMVHFRKESNSLRWNLYFSLDVLRQVVRFSIIDSSSYLFLAILTAVLNAFVSSQFGPKFLIVVSVVTLTREMQLLFEGIGEAVGPILSVYVGEENHSGLKSIYKLASNTAVIEGIAVTLVLVLIAPLVPRVLNVTDPELIRWIVLGMRLIALGSTFMSLLYLLTSYYLVIDQIVLGTVACALRDVLLSVGLAVILGKVIGLTGMFIGLAAAPVLAYALLMIVISARYVREDCPLLLSRVPGNEESWLFQLSVEPDQIIGLQKQVQALLEEKGVDRRIVGRIKLLIEELYILIAEKNEGKRVLSELTVFLRPEGIQMISKDDGVLFDISEDDVSVTSIASFVVSNYMEKLGNDKRHLTTMSFNRSAFLIQPLTN